MSYKVCVIDDAINSPAVEVEINTTNALNEECLKKILKANWGDQYLKKLIDSFISNDDYALTAYTNPTFFINDLKQGFFPEVIIYDWDYGTQPEPSEDSLKYILEKVFCFVYIYTAPEIKENIENILSDEQFNEFNNRLDIYLKEEDSVEKISKNLELLKNKNFSFKFGIDLRKKSIEAIESILINLGKLDIEKAYEILNIQGNNSKDLIEFIGERYKNNLSVLGLEYKKENTIDDKKKNQEKEIEDKNTKTVENLSEISENLWRYRLYYNPQDNYVRKGDIVCKKYESSLSELFLVINADCDLARFWNKNLGNLNLIKLYSIDEKKDLISELGGLTKNKTTLKEIKVISSFSNQISSIGGNLLYFPYLAIDNQFKDYIAFPKEIVTRKISMPKQIKNIQNKKQRDIPLTYKYWKNHKRLLTISEPFLTAIVEHIFSSIAGYGTPDYPDKLKEILATKFKGVF